MKYLGTFRTQIIFLKIDFVLANSVDPDEMPHYAPFYQGTFTVCQSTHLGVTSKQRVNQEDLIYYQTVHAHLKIDFTICHNYYYLAGWT